ncbi:MAG: iron-containing alcohol dehydrogenase [Leptospirales bacterium]|nr:iron-containing alcohol dehydrogenase [Leptospirales bacterium]
MNAAFCRAFQFVFNYGAKLMPWRKAVLIDGAGSINKIPQLLQTHSVKKPLVVTDAGLVKAGIAAMVTKILEQEGCKYAMFRDVEPNPSVNTVNAAYDFYISEGCDGFIAIGGGSPMDAAKAAAALVAHPDKSVTQLAGLLKARKKIPTFIAVPTTAGTGSETTIAALITDTETRHKYAIMAFSLIPHYAVLDPELTKGLPPSITAATGMDALTHAVEAYLCRTYNTKESIQYALDAVKDIFANLEKAYQKGSDKKARQAMLEASYKAGFAFTRAGVGNVHAIAHTLGGLYNTPHGLANAVILPKVLDDYGEAVHAKLAKLAETAGLIAPESKKSQAEKAKLFIKAVYEMNKRMGIPETFDFIKDEDIPQMAEWADNESNPLYPVPVIYGKERFKKVIESIRGKPKAKTKAEPKTKVETESKTKAKAKTEPKVKAKTKTKK